MTTPEIIGTITKNPDLAFLIVGGHAVIAHGYPRNTVDLDFLIRKTDRAAWVDELLKLGYEARHEHDNFIQFASKRGLIDVDLMLVNDTTFAAMQAAAKPTEFGGVSAKVPSLEHLIALKLHVLKQELRHRMLGDLDDVINLILANQVDIRSEKWRQLFEKYGSLAFYDQVLNAIR